METGSLDDLRHLTRTSVDVTTEADPTSLRSMVGVHDLAVDGHRARFEVDGAELPAIMRHVAELGVKALTSNPPTLEELFMRHYRETPA